MQDDDEKYKKIKEELDEFRRQKTKFQREFKK